MKVYNSKLLHFSRQNRKDQTPAEMKLWSMLRRKSFYGYKFRRQHPVLNYILDFYCIKLRLAIEIDGYSHDESKYNYDIKRQKDLETIGIKFLRFTEFEVKQNINNILDTIYNFITSTSP